MARQMKKLDDTGLDINRLRKEFNKLILPSKAKALGVSAEDLTVTFRGGKRVFTTRKKLATRLEKQRSIVGGDRRRTQRALRDGEESIIGEIDSRLTDCLRLLSSLAEAKRITPLDNRDTRTVLQSSADKAIRLGEELQGVEAEIERKKEADPILSRMDGLAHAIQAAKERGDRAAAARLTEANREDLARYESRRRALEPDIQHALHCRCGLLREQRRIMKTQLHLYSEWARVLQGSAQEALARMTGTGMGLKGRISSCLGDLAAQQEAAERLTVDRKGPDKASKNDVREQNRLREEEVTQLREAIQGLSLPITRLETLLEVGPKEETPHRRMVFRDQEKQR